MNNAQRAQWSLTLIRIMLGIVFIAHGGQKVLGIFGGPGLQGFVSWAGTRGIPTYLAYAAAFTEFIGGILLLLGVYAELGALMIICVMIGAIYFVHLPHGFFIQNSGHEYVVSLIVSGLAILVGGPGACALLRLKR